VIFFNKLLLSKVKIIVEIIVEMQDIHFLRKQKQFHNNPGINPETGKKLIKGKGPYLKFVELYGLPQKEEINIVIFPLQSLPGDLIEEILKHVDLTTKVSILLINKITNSLSGRYKDDIIKAALERELNYTKINLKPYFKRAILDIKLGDRINDGQYNYKVITIKARAGTLYRVDMLGNRIDDKIYDLVMIKNGKDYFWYIKKGEKEHININVGIIQYSYGPKIKSIDSRYLKYKTVSFEDETIPEINTMVFLMRNTGRIFADRLEYYISALSANSFTLKFVEGYFLDQPADTLDVFQFNNQYIVKDFEYKIVKIGGFLSQCYYD
jgi:hypothetical protein